MDFDPYKILKVDPTADEEVISAAYRALSKKYHPDLNKSAEAQTQMQQVNRAYEMLKDSASRAKVDAELARKSSSQSSGQGMRPSYTQPNYNSPPNYGTGGFQRNQPVSKGAERIYVATPDDNTFYLYQKRLVDDKEHKLLRIGVYHDKLFGKICNINATAPDASGKISSGSVFIQSLEMFDLTDAITEALDAMEKPLYPIETNSDHNVFYRRQINGLNSTYLVLEVIKRLKSDAKIVLFLIGERRGEGVIASQTQAQLKQLDKIFTEAFATMR
jgi:curved DNA-binding protein CbpA